MNIDIWQLFLLGIAYLFLLFGIASTAERGLIPERIVHHPIIYVLSLGVFASAFAIYGVVGLAHEYGYGFLSYYLGITGAFIFLPLLLMPMLRICRQYMHSSLADVLTFRYRSQGVGSLVTLCMLLAVMPLLAMQIQAVADSLHILSTDGSQHFSNAAKHKNVALAFCLIISIFTISFGSHHITTHERHNGLVVAIAFESIIKLTGLLVAGGVAIFYVFGGFQGLDQWLIDNPNIFKLLDTPLHADSARSLLLIFYSSAVAMPHLFHMIFAENPNIKVIKTASWALPLFALLISIPVLPILWGGFKVDSTLPPDYFALGLGIELNQPWLAMLVFIAGLSAASGAMIVVTIALASMCLKHLILPFYKPAAHRNVYRWLLLIRRLLMVLIILAGYSFYRIIVGRESLTDLSLAALIAGLQFLPGIIAAIYWPKANRTGLICGLSAGFTIWFFSMFLPIVSEFNPHFMSYFYFNYDDGELWNAATIVSVSVNTAIFILVSILTPSRPEEIAAAEACSTDDLNRPTRQRLRIRNPAEMKENLASALGQQTAEREVDRALKELSLSPIETRPLELRRLRFRLEINLSSLLGPSVAHEMIVQLLTDQDNETSPHEDLSLIEAQLENNKKHLTGLAADLDGLRRYHRQTLQDLPVGVCITNKDGEILMWNASMASITSISTNNTIGSLLEHVTPPWGRLLSDFINGDEANRYKQRLDTNEQPLWVNLHKASHSPQAAISDRVIIMEDATELQTLENELTHRERLASIGQLAAGVAHEIGNPVTGIACLAQNLEFDTDNPESLQTAKEILQQTERISKIVQTLVNFSHAGHHDHQILVPVDLHRCVEEAIHLLTLNKDAKQINFENRCPNPCEAVGDSQRIIQVLVNLFSNARDASPEHSTVIIASYRIKQQIFITVTDQGSGISAVDQEKIFDPFFTTKEAGKGTGLGLSLVYSIVEELKGQISVESPVDGKQQGCRFTLSLPATTESRDK